MEGDNSETRDTLSVLFKEKIPAKAINYYKKLYIQKHLVQGGKHTNSLLLLEAAKAWKNLSKEDKTAIEKQYDDLVLSHRRMYAEGLKNIEPYCKKKKGITEATPKILPAVDSVNKNDPTMETQDQLPVVMPPVSHDYITPESGHTSDSHILCESDHSHHIVSVPEPDPPKFRTAQELFVMIQTLDENLSTFSWATMTSTQKRRYQTALSVIKSQYISDYTKYLTSLSSLQLYKLHNHIM